MRIKVNSLIKNVLCTSMKYKYRFYFILGIENISINENT